MRTSETLEEERERLQQRLEQLNVHSPGRDRIVQRLNSIHNELLYIQTHKNSPISFDSNKDDQIHYRKSQTLRSENK